MHGWSLSGSFLCLPPPSGLSHPQGEAQSGTRVILDPSVLGSRHPGKESRWLRRSNSQHLMAGWEGPISLTAFYIPVPYYILHQKEGNNRNKLKCL